ncbi:MAG: nucleotidyl transferase AbiEii/AbiGii toxin family protein [Bdellovibrionota bacterium]
MKQSQNILWIETIAAALGEELRSKFVFTGGSVVELYYQRPALPEPRVTKDVDAIVSAATLVEYYRVEAELQKRGFVNAGLHGKKGPTCRYEYNGITFDVMPTEERVLGLSNRWFNHAMENPIASRLPSGNVIRLASFPRFLAIKLETLADRGGKDIRGSHDLEDIVRLVSGRLDPLAEINRDTDEIKSFLQASTKSFFEKHNFIEAIEASSQLGMEQTDRVTRVMEALARGLEKKNRLER